MNTAADTPDARPTTVAFVNCFDARTFGRTVHMTAREEGRLRARATGRMVVSEANSGEWRGCAPALQRRVRPKRVGSDGEPGGTRTHGPKIKSLVLYHLSYGLAPPALERQAKLPVNTRRHPFTSAATRM